MMMMMTIFDSFGNVMFHLDNGSLEATVLIYEKFLFDKDFKISYYGM